MRYDKFVFFALLSTLLIGFSGCGEDDEQKIKDKKVLVIYSGAQKGVCESKLFKELLEKQGLKGIQTEERSGFVTCSDMGRNASNCTSESLNLGIMTCIVGVDGFK